jgi:hypothetical protein
LVDLDVDALGTAREITPLDAGPGDVVEVALVGNDDALPLDDRATLVVGGGPERVVEIVGNGSPFLTALVDAVPGHATVADGTDDANLRIVDGGALPDIDRPTWLIAPDSPPPGVTLVELVRNAAVTYQRPGEPVLDSVDLSAVAVAQAQVVEAPQWLTLVRAGEVPLILLGEVNGHRVAYFTFDLTHSNLVVQVGFPILGARILEWLAGGSAGTISTEPAGAPIPLNHPAGTTAQVTMPDGTLRDLTPGAVAFADTGQPGVYRVSYIAVDGTTTEGPVAVRRFVAEESGGAARIIATTGGALAEEEPSTLVREWAPWVIALVILLMAVEWWVGHQRPGWNRSRRIEERPKAPV